MTVDDVLAAYLALRKRKEELKKEQADAMAPINDQMNKCLLWVQQQMQVQGLTNFKGPSGIAFLQTDTTVSVKDWDATLEWIKSTDNWSVLEKRVSKSVVQDFIEANNETPPGLHVSTEIAAHIRKS
jgi:hypothetical protein